MQCPVCSIDLVERCFGSARIDVCASGCHGLWCDWAELPGLDEPDEGFGAALDEALAQPATPRARAPLTCPRCRIPMHEHRYRDIPRVLIDECYECRGLFLDPGELGAIREHLGADATRRERVARILADDPVWQLHLLEVDAERERTAGVVQLSRGLLKRIQPFLLRFETLDPQD